MVYGETLFILLAFTIYIILSKSIQVGIQDFSMEVCGAKQSKSEFDIHYFILYSLYWSLLGTITRNRNNTNN